MPQVFPACAELLLANSDLASSVDLSFLCAKRFYHNSRV